MKPLFKSDDARTKILEWYGRFHARLQVPTERRTVHTRFGETHVLVGGPDESPPVGVGSETLQVSRAWILIPDQAFYAFRAVGCTLGRVASLDLQPSWQLPLRRPKVCGLGSGLALVGSEAELLCLALETGAVRWRVTVDGLPWSGVVDAATRSARVMLHHERTTSTNTSFAVSFPRSALLEISLDDGAHQMLSDDELEAWLKQGSDDEAQGGPTEALEIDRDDSGREWLVCTEANGEVRFRVRAVSGPQPELHLTPELALAWDDERITLFDARTGACRGEVCHSAKSAAHIHFDGSYGLLVTGWFEDEAVLGVDLDGLAEEARPTLRCTFDYEELPSRTVQMFAVLVAQARIEEGQDIAGAGPRERLAAARTLTEEKLHWLCRDGADDRPLERAHQSLEELLYDSGEAPDEASERTEEIARDVLALVETTKELAYEAAMHTIDPAMELCLWARAEELLASSKS